jgi:hypothetical protein
MPPAKAPPLASFPVAGSKASGNIKNRYPNCATVENAMRSFNPFCRSATMLPNKTAAAPRAPSNCMQAEFASTGIASNQTRSTIKTHQWHRGEGQKLQGDVESEQVDLYEHKIERSPYREQQSPERQWGARLSYTGRRSEIAAREYRDGADHHGDCDQHDH